MQIYIYPVKQTKENRKTEFMKVKFNFSCVICHLYLWFIYMKTQKRERELHSLLLTEYTDYSNPISQIPKSKKLSPARLKASFMKDVREYAKFRYGEIFL